MTREILHKALRICRGLVLMIGTVVISAVISALALLAASGPASAETFTNPTPIKIPASGSVGPASPYPSSVAVGGMSGPITDVNVTLHRFGHNFPGEIRILLVSPSGDTVVLMNQNCGGQPVEDFTWIFDQQASAPMPQDTSCPGFVYRPNPISGSSAYVWPAPAPAGPHGTSLNDFNNENPNGTWSLYVADGFDGDVGNIEGGWTLTLSPPSPRTGSSAT